MQKNDGNQFFVLFNGPLYFTFKQPSDSNSSPLFAPFPVVAEIEKQAHLPPAVSASGETMKVLPDPSVVSLQKSVESFKSSDPPNLMPSELSHTSQKLKSSPIEAIESSSSKTEDTGVIPEVPLERTNKSSQISLQLPVIPDFSGLLRELRRSTALSENSTALPENVKMDNSTELREKLTNVSSGSSEELKNIPIAAQTRKKSFEEHLEEFLRYFLPLKSRC